jgi:hypothetical protein
MNCSNNLHCSKQDGDMEWGLSSRSSEWKETRSFLNCKPIDMEWGYLLSDSILFISASMEFLGQAYKCIVKQIATLTRVSL